MLPKCHFEEIDTETSIGKKRGFDYHEESFRSILNKILQWQY